MGSSQSQVTPEVASHEKQVVEVLRSMKVQNKTTDDEGYVYIDVRKKKPSESHNEKVAASQVKRAREAEDLSVDQVQAWQSSLLRDPKSRQVDQPGAGSVLSTLQVSHADREAPLSPD